MNNIPFEFLWGLDVAIKKLRPGAHFQLNNRTFEIWNDPEGRDPPSWEEITFQIQEDQEAAKIWAEENNLKIKFEELRPEPPNDNKNYFWNEDEKVWEQEPDYDIE